MENPQTLNQCGHHFCQTCIVEALGQTATCPVCGVPAWASDLHACPQAIAMLSAVQSLQDVLADNWEPTRGPRDFPDLRKAESEGFGAFPLPSEVIHSNMKENDQSKRTTLLALQPIQPSCLGTSNKKPARVAPVKTTESREGPPITKPSTAKKPKTNHLGETPLHTAAHKGDLARIKQLLATNTINVNHPDNARWTALHEACNQGHVAVAEALLIAGGNVNASGFENNTPLHDAAFNGHVDTVKLLLLHGADRTAVNQRHLTPYEMAETDAIRSLLHSPPANPLTEIEGTELHPPMETGQNMDIDTHHYEGTMATSRVNPVILLTGLCGKQKEQVMAWAGIMGALVVTKMDSSVTHLVAEATASGLAKRTSKYLAGVLMGKWIVTYEWMKACVTAGRWVGEVPYIVKGDAHGLDAPLKAVQSLSANNAPLFHDCCFVFRGDFVTHPLNELRRLVRLG
eukprot:Ihof_evm5s511 gene=Ihof_evmTU5s511